jgi:hypothetical protein
VQTVALPAKTVLLSEWDFLRALYEGKPGPAAAHDAAETRRLLSLANSDEALGISARYSGPADFSGELFAVTRDPALMPDGRIMVTEYYLAAVKLSGRSSWQGMFPEIALSGRIPNLANGDCGLVSAPTTVPRCDRPPCELISVSLEGNIGPPVALPPPGTSGSPPIALPTSRTSGTPPAAYSVEPNEPRFGADRWPAGNRVTLRLPVFDVGGKRVVDLSAIACSDHWPPREREPNPGGCGNNEVEMCNGLDDDCDQDIDEGDVCASRNTQCSCAPKSCAELGVECGVVHDGCTKLLTCGGPCP